MLIISSMAMFKSLSTLYMKKGANDQVKYSGGIVGQIVLLVDRLDTV